MQRSPASYRNSPPSQKRAARGTWLLRAAGAWVLGLLTAGCSTLNLYSVQDDKVIGLRAYEEMMAQEDVITSGPDVARVQRVFHRLVEVADDPADFEWEVKLVRGDDVVNAWALPGGKTAVYTGMLRVAQTDAQLAVVMGHEISHATARHGTERMTRELGMQAVVSILISQSEQADSAQWADLGFQLVGLSYSREDELEADHLGLLTMARAGYDPREAPRFWERMQALGGSQSLELLSTHPSDQRRIEALEASMDEALALYAPR